MKSFGNFALVAGLMCFGVAPAWADTTPEPTKNVQDPVNHPYQQYGYADCTGKPGGCTVEFPRVESEVLIEHASCFYYMADTGLTLLAELSTKTGDNPTALPVFSYSDDGVGTIHGFNQDTMFFLKKGEAPSMFLSSQTEAIQDLNCTLSGYYR